MLFPIEDIIAKVEERDYRFFLSNTNFLRSLILLKNSNKMLLTSILKLEEISSFSRDNFINSMKFKIDQSKSTKLSLSKLKEKILNGFGTLSKISTKKC